MRPTVGKLKSPEAVRSLGQARTLKPIPRTLQAIESAWKRGEIDIHKRRTLLQEEAKRLRVDLVTVGDPRLPTYGNLLGIL